MKKILIVEDEEAIGKIMQEELEDHDFKVMLINEGGQAVFDAVKGFAPDIILLDLQLPKMSGMDMLKHFKSENETKAIPIIIISNMDKDEDIQNSLALGAADYFVKSQHPVREVVEKVRKYVTSQ
jgi:DNA-binding response OmpR family regulator